MSKRSIINAGDSYERLTLTGEYYIDNDRMYVSWVCDCGKTGWSILANIKKGNTKSCGCLNRELASNRLRTHGLVNEPLYQVWCSVKNRCDNANDPDYGGKGVKVCDEWVNNFPAFYKWALSNGYKKGLHLDKDKLSPTGSGMVYCPEYCSFITPLENSRNRGSTIKIEYKGENKTLFEWCAVFKIKYHTAYCRLKVHKWDVDKVFETPINKL